MCNSLVEGKNVCLHCQNCWISYPRKSSKFPELLLFLNQGNLLRISFTGKSRNRYKTMCQNFLGGNLLKISLAFPLDFLPGKLNNTGSVK